MKRCAPLVLLVCLMACTPSPQKVNEAIGRGQLETAVRLLTELLNEDGPITSRKLDSLLDALSVSRKFDLDLADTLFEGLKQEGREVILRWYINEYLQLAENALQNELFDVARQIWTRHQKVRALYFPDFQEATPVLGIIDLREAEYWLNKKNKPKARQLMASARRRLTRRRPFDRVEQYAFRNLVQDLDRRLK
ncbi:MAG: hypothetical protein ACO1RX_17170 [Candidatus Sericytochromatia bacterium]